MKIGFTIGKFAPLHKGHEALIEKGINEMDKFYVVIYDTPELNIDINTKIKWIKNRFPNVFILTAYNSPKKYGLDKDSVNIQMEYLYNIIKDINANYFYSSELYGKYASEYLGINNVLFDIDRTKYNISASLIRSDINKYKEFINDEVFNDLKNA